MGVVTTETAPNLDFTETTAADMAFITATIARLRRDGERPAPEPVITLRRGGRLIPCGPIKP